MYVVGLRCIRNFCQFYFWGIRNMTAVTIWLPLTPVAVLQLSDIWFVAFLSLLFKWRAINRPCGIRSRDSCFLLLITLCMTTLFNLRG